jgi:hypothetical protein
MCPLHLRYFLLFPGNNNNSEGRQIDLKSEQWFGATLQSSGEDGVVVVSSAGSDEQTVYS